MRERVRDRRDRRERESERDEDREARPVNLLRGLKWREGKVDACAVGRQRQN